MEWDKMTIKELYKMSGMTRTKVIEVFELNPNTWNKVLSGERHLTPEKEKSLRLFFRTIIEMNTIYNFYFKKERN
jgi:plasmid maintenance system antidote protein VapI